MLTLEQVWSRVDVQRQLNAGRDQTMLKMEKVRAGEIALVAPDLFSDEWPEPVAANQIDIAARDLAETTAPLPTFTCNAGDRSSDSAIKAADKRTRIVYGYVANSNLQLHQYSNMDNYFTYGFTPYVLELDFNAALPTIRAEHPVGVHYQIDRFGRPVWMGRVVRKPIVELVGEFPELERQICGPYHRASSTVMLEVVYYQDKDQMVFFVPERDNLVLQKAKNPLGKPMFYIAERPGSKKGRGQFDDVLWVQLARARFALMALEAAEKSVKAPMAMPLDVQELSFGGDETIRTNTPQGVRRVELPIPAGVFQQRAALDEDMRLGARFPEARTGEIGGSIVTGKGVQALMGGFDTQIKAAQAVHAVALEYLTSLALEADQKVWPSREKRIRGNANGAAYEIKYKPSKDIDGNYVVDVQYGLMAGLDPNRALVFGLQARAEDLISRDFLRRQMPWSINVTEEEQRIDTEKLRDALGQAVMGYAQAIPMLAQNGQSPNEVLTALTTVIEARKKGEPMETAIANAFPPPPPPPPTPEAAPPAPGMDPTTSGAPGIAGPGGQGVDGLQASGLPIGVPEGGMQPGSRPDLAVMLAGLSGSGAPSMAARVERRRAI